METKELATLGGGCFWCLDTMFDDLLGVVKVESGYSGGEVINPSYEDVCSGTTGHAEVVQVTFNPEIITFEELLEIFFTIHDPTTLNRQGNDVGTQYRSAIFYHSPEQKDIVKKVIKEFNEKKIWDNPIVTEVSPLKVFFRAEEYHQNYYQRNPDQPYCRLVITPKIVNFRKKYLDKLKK
ncbi:MAG: peptide-methionine (S)-S-oxide reductase MsrA [Candidatus Hodarchaeales archaeon]|jgi:peptide-methionine (S)-S-oxide reductase